MNFTFLISVTMIGIFHISDTMSATTAVVCFKESKSAQNVTRALSTVHYPSFVSATQCQCKVWLNHTITARSNERDNSTNAYNSSHSNDVINSFNSSDVTLSVYAVIQRADRTDECGTRIELASNGTKDIVVCPVNRTTSVRAQLTVRASDGDVGLVRITLRNPLMEFISVQVLISTEPRTEVQTTCIDLGLSGVWAIDTADPDDEDLEDAAITMGIVVLALLCIAIAIAVAKRITRRRAIAAEKAIQKKSRVLNGTHYHLVPGFSNQPDPEPNPIFHDWPGTTGPDFPSSFGATPSRRNRQQTDLSRNQWPARIIDDAITYARNSSLSSVPTGHGCLWPITAERLTRNSNAPSESNVDDGIRPPKKRLSSKEATSYTVTEQQIVDPIRAGYKDGVLNRSSGHGSLWPMLTESSQSSTVSNKRSLQESTSRPSSRLSSRHSTSSGKEQKQIASKVLLRRHGASQNRASEQGGLQPTLNDEYYLSKSRDSRQTISPVPVYDPTLDATHIASADISAPKLTSISRHTAASKSRQEILVVSQTERATSQQSEQLGKLLRHSVSSANNAGSSDRQGLQGQISLASSSRDCAYFAMPLAATGISTMSSNADRLTNSRASNSKSRSESQTKAEARGSSFSETEI